MRVDLVEEVAVRLYRLGLSYAPWSVLLIAEPFNRGAPSSFLLVAYSQTRVSAEKRKRKEKTTFTYVRVYHLHTIFYF